MASKPTCDAGFHVTLGCERPSGSICDSLAANGGGKSLPTYVRRVLAVLRHLITRNACPRHHSTKTGCWQDYPIRRRCCGTLQHRRFHTGGVGSGVRIPLAPPCDESRRGLHLSRAIGYRSPP